MLLGSFSVFAGTVRLTWSSSQHQGQLLLAREGLSKGCLTHAYTLSLHPSHFNGQCNNVRNERNNSLKWGEKKKKKMLTSSMHTKQLSATVEGRLSSREGNCLLVLISVYSLYLQHPLLLCCSLSSFCQESVQRGKGVAGFNTAALFG